MAPDPVEHFAAEAEDARERIASTIDAIQDRLDPRRILNDAVERVSSSGTQMAVQARDTLKAHPLAVGAGIAAIGLALLARNKLANARVDLGDGTGDYTDYDDGYGFAEEPAQRFYGDDDEPVSAADRARALAARAEDGVAASPFVAILLGLAAGAALGALFPATETERRALGETSQKLGAAARAAARRTADELEAAGLSVGAVKARAGDAGRKARAAVRSVAAAAREEFKG